MPTSSEAASCTSRGRRQARRMRENPPEAPARLLNGPEMTERIDVAAPRAVR